LGNYLCNAMRQANLVLFLIVWLPAPEVLIAEFVPKLILAFQWFGRK
jgi:hypothetical protein